jgi:hypothetical protein
VSARDRTLAMLAVAALALAALIVWDRGRPSTDEQAKARAELLPSFQRAAATEIAVVRGARTTTLRHEAGGWFTADPHRRADDGAVDGLLAALEYGRIERRLGPVDAATRHQLGLDQPRVIVRVAGHVLRLGLDAPARAVYVERDGEPGPLVAEHRLIEVADLEPSLWRSSQLTLADPAAAGRIAYGAWTLERRAGWRVVRPVETRASDAKVDALVQALGRARARRSLDDVVDAGVAGPGVPLALDGALQAHIAGACPGAPAETLVTRADGAVLCFASTDLSLLRAPSTTFHERRLFPVRLDDIVAADVGPLSLRREAGRWRIIAPAPALGYAADAAVRAWLEPIVTAEARAFVTAAPVAGVRIRLATRDDDVTANVAATQARRAGESVTLDLMSPLLPSTDPLPLLPPPPDLSH